MLLLWCALPFQVISNFLAVTKKVDWYRLGWVSRRIAPEVLCLNISCPAAWDGRGSWGSVFWISGSAMTSADCCQGDISDLQSEVRRCGMCCVQLYSLKEYGKKSLVMICQVLLIAANYICSSVALVSKLIWKEEKTCTNYFTW